MSHTPGPWSVLTLDDGTEWIQSGCVRVAIVDDSAGCQLGNAALIAAAPEMLAALTEVEIELDAYPHCPLCRHVHGGHRQNCVGHLVNVAIKKAEDDNGNENDEEATVEDSGGNSNADRLLKQHIRREYKRTKHSGKARGVE